MRKMAGIAVFVVAAGFAGVAFAAEVIVDGVPHVRNSSRPAGGVETWRLEPLWSVGDEEDDVMLGLVGEAVSDEAGNVYLLDRQLCQVQVFSEAGAHLRSLSRQGEGPGELRRPSALTLLPDGRLGVGEAMPGRIVVLDRMGVPAGTIELGKHDLASAPLQTILHDAECRDGHLAVVARTLRRTGQGMEREVYLATVGMDGRELARILESHAPDRIIEGRYVEREEYFVDRGGWALGRGGRVYAAAERDHYAVHVFSPEGRLERVIEREFEPRKRTAEEKARVGEGLIAIVNGRRIQIEAEAEDFDPAILALRAAPDGRLWVLSSRGANEQAAGVLGTYDVFDEGGSFVSQVAIAGAGDSDNDRLLLLSDDRAILVRNFIAAVRARDGEGGGPGAGGGEEAAEAEDASPLEVVYCALRKG